MTLVFSFILGVSLGASWIVFGFAMLPISFLLKVILISTFGFGALHISKRVQSNSYVHDVTFLLLYLLGYCAGFAGATIWLVAGVH